MSEDEIRRAIATLAKAILELSERGGRVWDYDGETMTGVGH